MQGVETDPLIIRGGDSPPSKVSQGFFRRCVALAAYLSAVVLVALGVSWVVPGTSKFSSSLSFIKYGTQTKVASGSTTSTTPYGASSSTSSTTSSTATVGGTTDMSMDTGLIYSSASSTASTTVFDRTNSMAVSNNGGVVAVIPSPTEPIEFDLARDGYDVIPVMSNEYLKYSFLDHYDAVLEPYASMNLVVDGMNESTTYYRFSVCPYESTNTADCKIGSLMPLGQPETTVTVNVTCDSFDKFYIYVSEFDLSTEKMTRTTTGAGICMYVRREIRSLSDEDLSATMDAMYTLWEYDQDEGEALYGEWYMAASTLLKFHHFNSAWQDADHIHEGNGFILQHIKQTNIFEKSMQAVDPSVSLPYWDFTIESANGTALWDSVVFSPEVFGSMPNCSDSWWGFQSWEDVEDAKIPDGRWAGVKADWNEDYDDLLAGYGYMRAPWSMNPSPYVSRFTTDWQIGTTLPRCSSHYGMLEYTDLMDFLMDAGDDPHSSAHSLVGGMYGCDLLSPMLAQELINDHTGLMTICGKWAFVMKELYRNNLISPLTNCSTNTYECGFECLNEDDDSGDLLFLVKELISDSVPDTLGIPQWEKWEDFICTGDGYKIVPGDHLESASPTDPSFWPIHPTLERLMQAKFMSGGFENNTWHTDPVNENVCHHASCYESYINDTFAFYPECCYGHYQYDQMLNAISGSKYEYYGPTNDAILTGTNPTGMYTMPYLYDDFSWDHCLDVDVDFDDLLDGFYKQYVSMEDDYMDDTFNSTLNATMHAVHTPHPTKFPTQEPTAKPSRSPSETKKPTFEPTEKPTRSPDSTRPPSAEPTLKPTSKPTHSPDYTHKPSFEPTEKPTRSPASTHSPTNPTPQPTVYPTDFPTTKPTRSPDATHSPTLEPTNKPTRSPDFTHSPTHSPDWTPPPSETPTEYPTHSPDWTPPPTEQPTEYPTLAPTPTPKPTHTPTRSPDYTQEPTHEPTDAPTHSPDWTAEPTAEPTSAEPTLAPTHEPTEYPTHSPDWTPEPTTRFDFFVAEDSGNSASGKGQMTSSGGSEGADKGERGSSGKSSDKKSSDKKSSDKKSEKKAKKSKEEKKAEAAEKRAKKKKQKAKRDASYKKGDKNSRFRLRD